MDGRHLRLERGLQDLMRGLQHRLGSLCLREPAKVLLLKSSPPRDVLPLALGFSLPARATPLRTRSGHPLPKAPRTIAATSPGYPSCASSVVL